MEVPATIPIPQHASGTGCIAVDAVDGPQLVTRQQVVEGIADMIPDVQAEAMFPDGAWLVTVHHRSDRRKT
jgi:urease gamma subunit